jgi:ATP-dependent DNA helicase PIF1
MNGSDNLDYAWNKLNEPSGHIFLTGNAGTGKTTLIRKFIEEHEGRCVVLAPTGIAAVQCGGQTIHSFFQFPARPISYQAVKFLGEDKPEDIAKRELIENTDFFIFDEASMIRADLMDQIGWYFHKNFPSLSPFAGKKIIMVGDLDQLPPVVATEEESQMLAKRYSSPFFFSAGAWSIYSTFETIKLTKVWRQTDPVFVELLNNIKNNHVAPFDIDRLNVECIRYSTEEDQKPGIMICTTNKLAAEENAIRLNKLDSPLIVLEGTIRGDFSDKSCLVDKTLHLKIGCRVMTMRNDPYGNYSNGSIGTLKGYDPLSGLTIEFDNGAVIAVGRYTFESVEFKYSNKEDLIKHQITGQFIQYPIRLAYAITIHKAQGQTFDKVRIDMGYGAFAHGQLYVALSRCRSLEGITLIRPVTGRDLIYDKHIVQFNKFINQ